MVMDRKRDMGLILFRLSDQFPAKLGKIRLVLIELKYAKLNISYKMMCQPMNLGIILHVGHCTDILQPYFLLDWAF